MKKETREQLDLFRRQQEEAERKTLEDENTDAPKKDQVQWVVPGRKRKKGPETNILKGVKLRKSSSAAEGGIVDATTEKEEPANDALKNTNANPTATTTKALATAHSEKALNTLSLELGYPSSDDDD